MNAVFNQSHSWEYSLLSQAKIIVTTQNPTPPCFEVDIMNFISKIEPNEMYVFEGTKLKQVIRDSYLGRFDRISLSSDSNAQNINRTKVLNLEELMPSPIPKVIVRAKMLISRLYKASEWIRMPVLRLLKKHNPVDWVDKLPYSKSLTSKQIEDYMRKRR